MERNGHEHIRAELHVRQLNRIYAVLSAINQLIIRGGEPQDTLDSACLIAVNKGDFRMAWIGMLDATRQILKPVAWAGMCEGYLDALTIDLKDAASNTWPSVRALLTGEHHVCNDIKSEQFTEPWRAAALKRGYRSGAAFPLKVAGKTIGILRFMPQTRTFLMRANCICSTNW
jgi:GAF domain-containing protein